ncbi:AbrB family transcriptional regulator [Aureimonas populi]|uniref:AbrB family transcriptional regulator n=1 Tax=Aureimonas populi TaxID=1701758 RepID=A0ABW5CJY7_9HYPH|nr:AbrB family transcriptional regulator [Aureimonas populi]
MKSFATLAISAAGGAAAYALGLPVAWLLGGLVAVVLAILAGLPARVPDRVRDVAFFFLGIQAGSGVTPEVLDQLVLWPLSFLVQMAGVAAVVAATFLFLRHAFGWDRQTALFASIPGALSFVVAAASQTRADMTRVVIVQSVRLLLLIGFLVPVLAMLEGGEGVGGGHAAPPGPIAWDQYAILFGGSLLGAWLGIKSRLPGGLILGSLLASAILHGTQIAPVPLPPFLAVASLIVVGALIGARLRPGDRGMLVQLAPASLGAFAIGLAVSALAAGVAVVALGLEPGKVALAYAPGALEALTVLAYQFQLDPAYVAAHHVVRFVILALLVPIFARRIARRSEKAAQEIAARDTSEPL